MENNCGARLSTDTSAIYYIYGEDDIISYISINDASSPRVYHDILRTPSLHNYFSHHPVRVKRSRTKSTFRQIPLWVLFVLLLFIIVAIFGYFNKIKNDYVDNTSVIYTNTKHEEDNEEVSALDSEVCNIEDEYFMYSWYVSPYSNPGYHCVMPKLITIINIQGLQITDHVCNDTSHCLELIAVYIDLVDNYAKYNFYIDYKGNVYGGRGWRCQSVSGELWVAVMVNDINLETASSERERILKHLNEDIYTYATECHYYDSSIKINYLNNTRFHKINILEFDHNYDTV